VGESADQLREEIDAKRDDAAAKIDQIEARVYDTAQMARDTVDETMQQARDTVVETVETVKQSFDLTHQVRERPWPTLGAAVAGGFMLGRLLEGDDGGRGSEFEPARRYAASYKSGAAAVEHPQPADAGPSAVVSGLRDAAKSAGLDEMVSNLSGALLGVLAERIRAVVEQNFPEFADQMRIQSQRHGDRVAGSTWRGASAPADAAARPPGYATPPGGSGLPG
jgi:ElaB/YqjD/DUF883 family membrane-anchored ribosome-binding protein